MDLISVCVTIKNRSRVKVEDRELTLFPHCVSSLVDAVGRDIRCELIVADWHSDDWPLETWLPGAAAPLALRIVQIEGAFCKGRGLNAAAAAASGDTLFFIDADALLCTELFTSGLAHVQQGHAYFPVLYSFHDAGHTTGWWRHEGYGHCMLTRAMFERAGGWPEYQSWGREDDDFAARVGAFAHVVRDEVPGFFHQWHPNDIPWKNRYYAEEPLFVRDMKRAEVALGEMARVVDGRDKLILIDGDVVPAELRSQWQTLPFLERDGQYWGLPASDEVAIHELERMRREGVRYMALLWPAFWWLDHYAAFRVYLDARFRRVLDNDNALVFDLQSSD